MTKPREKTREELTAEIEEGKKKIRQFENREKIIKQKLSVEERKARNHRLCKRGGFMESLVPELIAMPDEDAKALYIYCYTAIGMGADGPRRGKRHAVRWRTGGRGKAACRRTDPGAAGGQNPLSPGRSVRICWKR